MVAAPQAWRGKLGPLYPADRLGPAVPVTHPPEEREFSPRAKLLILIGAAALAWAITIGVCWGAGQLIEHGLFLTPGRP